MPRDEKISQRSAAFGLLGHEEFPIAKTASSAEKASIATLGDFLNTKRNYSAKYKRTSAFAVPTGALASVPWQSLVWSYGSGWPVPNVTNISFPVNGIYAACLLAKLGGTVVADDELQLDLDRSLLVHFAQEWLDVGGTGQVRIGDWVSVFGIANCTTAQTFKLETRVFNSSSALTLDIDTELRLALLQPS